LEIILRSDLSCSDQVNYTVKKSYKALHFTMRILKKGNSNAKHLAYTPLVRPILKKWGGVLGSLQRGADKCVRPGAKESGQICTAREGIELGNLDRAQEVTLMCSLQSIHG
jgi:hypothetical protein